MESFAAFLAYMGRKPSPAYSVERIDNDGDYKPGNVEWATRIVQANNKYTSRRIVVDGKSVLVAEVATRARPYAQRAGEQTRQERSDARISAVQAAANVWQPSVCEGDPREARGWSSVERGQRISATARQEIRKRPRAHPCCS